MNNSKKHLWFRLLLLLVSTAMLPSAIAWARSPQGQFEKTFSVNGPVNLEVLSRSGDITVRTGGTGSVVVRGKIYVGDRWFTGSRQGDVHAIEQNPPLRQDGNSIHIEHVPERDISVDYEITVPVDTSVHTHSGSGDQTISGTHGSTDLETGSGDIKIDQITGDMHLSTGSGNVRAHSIQGSVRGSTGSGDVEVEETGGGDVEFRTGSGNVTARGVHGSFRGETGSGDVTGEGDITGPWEIHTGSGNVRVRLPGNAAFEANLSTSSGSLEVNAPVTTTVQGRVQDMHKSIRGQVRGGGPMLTVRTGSGDIHVD